ncbi:hypothetical protein MAR_014131 [Mya arenaria]|uniref:Uncharacterized protein n=1 Tax=Mya arenaria TaxID=6604 RepID=A0ABY7G3F1_MYAAR|nr:hypothetical protein MAR_014131 [Mya arenaria]
MPEYEPAPFVVSLTQENTFLNDRSLGRRRRRNHVRGQESFRALGLGPVSPLLKAKAIVQSFCRLKVGKDEKGQNDKHIALNNDTAHAHTFECQIKTTISLLARHEKTPSGLPLVWISIPRIGKNDNVTLWTI